MAADIVTTPDAARPSSESIGISPSEREAVSNAMIGDDFALRACVVNYRTKAADMEILLETIRRVAARTSQSV